MSNEGDKLLPCPFCGGTALDVWQPIPYGTWQIGCSNCQINIGGRWETLADEIKHWNTRATPVVSREEVGNMAAHIAEVVGTMRGWGKEDTSAYHAANFVYESLRKLLGVSHG